jgi:hypothetical protein
MPDFCVVNSEPISICDIVLPCFLVVSQLCVCFVITIIQAERGFVKPILKLFYFYFGDFRLYLPACNTSIPMTTDIELIELGDFRNSS